jgi:hypothetical protein
LSFHQTIYQPKLIMCVTRPNELLANPNTFLNHSSAPRSLTHSHRQTCFGTHLGQAKCCFGAVQNSRVTNHTAIVTNRQLFSRVSLSQIQIRGSNLTTYDGREKQQVSEKRSKSCRRESFHKLTAARNVRGLRVGLKLRREDNADAFER